MNVPDPSGWPSFICRLTTSRPSARGLRELRLLRPGDSKRERMREPHQAPNRETFGPGLQAEPHFVWIRSSAGGAPRAERTKSAVLGTRDTRVNPEDEGPQSMETLKR